MLPDFLNASEGSKIEKGMARFSINTDVGYKRIIGEVKRWVRPLRSLIEPRTIPRGTCQGQAPYPSDMTN
jgi:hypothetical protein